MHLEPNLHSAKDDFDRWRHIRDDVRAGGRGDAVVNAAIVLGAGLAEERRYRVPNSIDTDSALANQKN